MPVLIACSSYHLAGVRDADRPASCRARPDALSIDLARQDAEDRRTRNTYIRKAISIAATRPSDATRIYSRRRPAVPDSAISL